MDDVARIAAERDELAALQSFNDALGGPHFTLRRNWAYYRRLVRRGLVKWGDPPGGFDKRRFAGTEITAKGRDHLLKGQTDDR